MRSLLYVNIDVANFEPRLNLKEKPINMKISKLDNFIFNILINEPWFKCSTIVNVKLNFIHKCQRVYICQDSR